MAISLSEDDPLDNEASMYSNDLKFRVLLSLTWNPLWTIRQIPPPRWLFERGTWYTLKCGSVFLISARGISSRLSPESQDSVIARICKSSSMIKSQTEVVLFFTEQAFHDARRTFDIALLFWNCFVATIWAAGKSTRQRLRSGNNCWRGCSSVEPVLAVVFILSVYVSTSPPSSISKYVIYLSSNEDIVR